MYFDDTNMFENWGIVETYISHGDHLTKYITKDIRKNDEDEEREQSLTKWAKEARSMDNIIGDVK